MLACLRHTGRRLFSTTAANSYSSAKPFGSVHHELEGILVEERDLSKTAPEQRASRATHPYYRIFLPSQPLLPSSLTYKNTQLKQKIFKRAAVAPPPSVTHQRDTFHQLNLDPRHFSSNASVLSHFVTEMGKIKGRDQTALTSKTQRLMGRTIRRAKMMGTIPILSSKGHKKFY